ncbi:MAG: hypothetical protein ABW223_11805 [Rariglobus sp.]
MRSPYPTKTTSKAAHLLRLALPAFAACTFFTSSLPGAEIVAELPPLGVLSEQLPLGLSGRSFPLIGEELINGRVASNDTTSVTFTASSSSIGLALAGKPDARYYLEVLSGPLEGERFDIDADATTTRNGASIVLNLTTSSASTANELTSDALIDARCAVRPHVTLKGLQEQFSPPLAGSNNPNLGDAVQVLGPTGFTTYYLRADGVEWRRSGSAENMASLVIPPDVSVLIRLKSGSKQWSQFGSVRTNAFRKNLTSDVQSFASGFPIERSPQDLGAVVDPALPAAIRWSGSNNPATADSFLLFAPDAGTFRTYYLRSNGTSWFQLGGTGEDFSGEAFLPASGMTLIQRAKSDTGYVIPPPLSL